jgi:hypothetical protein
MLELRTPFELIESVIARSHDAHGGDISPEEVCEPIAAPSALWLLDLAARAAVLPPSPNALLTPDPEDMAEAVRSGKMSSGISAHVSPALLGGACACTFQSASEVGLGIARTLAIIAGRPSAISAGWPTQHASARPLLTALACLPLLLRTRLWCDGQPSRPSAPASGRPWVSLYTTSCCGLPWSVWLTAPTSGHGQPQHSPQRRLLRSTR